MAGKFTLNILGTASAKPNRMRASSAQLLQAAGRLFLIDCSEDTQRRILLQNDRVREWAREHKEQGLRRLSATTLDAIFISHIHGDHLFGLFPLLSTLSLNGRSKSLTIVGPANLGPVLNFYKSYWGDKDPYELKFIPLKSKEPECILEYADLRVSAFPLNHGVDTYGFLFREVAPLSGIDRNTDANEWPLAAARSFAYCSDTAPFADLAGWVRGVDVLYHEATYMEVDAAKSHNRYHSTTLDAARCALEAGVGRLLTAHYSSAIKDEMIHAGYEAELRSVFPRSFALDDGDIIDIPAIL